jgi:hypothetical protein
MSPAKRKPLKNLNFSEKVKLFSHNLFTTNPRQKWFSLIVALFVWGFVIGQKETVMEKEVSLQYQLKAKVEMLDSVKKVKVKLSGPSISLRKFNDQPSSLLIDISEYPVGGLYSVELSKEGLNVPLGVKILSITPNRVPIVLRAKPE